jgi:radical SAM protein with 4Fe4S-binding SPASM domain
MFSEINIELTSRCQKHCQICPRWKDGKEKGDIPFSLLEKIEPQLDDNVLIHFHNNGEPLLYDKLYDVAELFKRQIKHFDTNGISLVKRFLSIQYFNIISVSIIEDDPIGTEQLSILTDYINDCKPENQKVIARCVGNIDEERMRYIKGLNIPIVHRVIHHPSGRNNYTKETIKPEDFICRDFLNHPAIDFKGNFYMCVKYDPEGIGILGNVNDTPIKAMWYGKKRMEYLENHIKDRNDIEFCKNCEYYGYPNA